MSSFSSFNRINSKKSSGSFRMDKAELKKKQISQVKDMLFDSPLPNIESKQSQNLDKDSDYTMSLNHIDKKDT